MPSDITIDINHLNSSNQSGSQDILIDVLKKLNASVDKLNSNLSKVQSTRTYTRKPKSDSEKAVDKLDSTIKQLPTIIEKIIPAFLQSAANINKLDTTIKYLVDKFNTKYLPVLFKPSLPAVRISQTELEHQYKTYLPTIFQKLFPSSPISASELEQRYGKFNITTAKKFNVGEKYYNIIRSVGRGDYVGSGGGRGGGYGGGVGGDGDIYDADYRVIKNRRKLSSYFDEDTGSNIFKSIIGGIGASLIRYVGAEANAMMSRATIQGSFVQSGMRGTANQDFGNYISQLYTTERAKQVAQRTILYEGIGGTAGGVIGAAGGGALGTLTSLSKLGINSSSGALLGGAAGYAGGNYYAATKNVDTIKQLMLASALAERRGNAAISEWQTGFARFGNKMTDTEIVPGSITGGAAIRGRLSQAFESMYGGSQNYNQILNNITPYLNTNPLSQGKTGDLNQVAQSLLKAGFSAQEFSKVTTMSAQYSIVTGKNLQKYAEDINKARARFGYSYDLGTEQTALNLMSTGYKPNDARELAYQSQFNPNLMSNVQSFQNNSFVDYYRKKAIGQSLGFDIVQSEHFNKFVGTDAARKKLEAEIKQFDITGAKGNNLLMLEAAGKSVNQVKSILQGRAVENLTNTDLDTSKSLGQQVVDAIQSGIANIKDMNVTATNVYINHDGATNKNNVASITDTKHYNSPATNWMNMNYMYSPALSGGSNSPAKK